MSNDDSKKYVIAAPIASCAFCGNRSLLLVESCYESGYFVCCEHCAACGPCAPDAEEAIERWSNRLNEAEISNYQRLIAGDTTH